MNPKPPPTDDATRRARRVTETWRTHNELCDPGEGVNYDDMTEDVATLIRQTAARVRREIRVRIEAMDNDTPERERSNLLWRDAVLDAIKEPTRRRTMG